MSQAPYAVRNIRFGTKFGFDLKVGDWLTFIFPFQSPKCLTQVFMKPWLGHEESLSVNCKRFNTKIKPLLFCLTARGHLVGRSD